MTKKNICALWCLIAATVVSVQAQSPELIDKLLVADPAPLSLAAELLVFIGSQTGVVVPQADETPFETAKSAGFFPQTVTGPDQPLEMRVAALALVEAFSLHSGLLYPLQRNPRSAMRELDYRGILPKGTAIDTPVSGEMLLRLVSTVIGWEQRYGDLEE